MSDRYPGREWKGRSVVEVRCARATWGDGGGKAGAIYTFTIRFYYFENILQ